MYIADYKELRLAYRLMRWAKLNDKEDYAEELKNSIRAYYRRRKNRPVRRTIYASPMGGYFVRKEILPVAVDTEEGAENYFDDVLFLSRPDCLYDCSGEYFTIDHKVAHQAGRWVVYHTIGIDV